MTGSFPFSPCGEAKVTEESVGKRGGEGGKRALSIALLKREDSCLSSSLTSIDSRFASYGIRHGDVAVPE
ncbi:hypothetical protein OPV22_010734 [Ensete ventricosum]|uniref:Uncharacterized protein n=1 Tax=Ensete ventricosum TaxID=4639 RepID=A0AAV8RG93_ENSVE|nr:hypothetical protein OPV22_010734 [Ensete ventricosum]